MANFTVNTQRRVRFGPFLSKLQTGGWRVICVCQDSLSHLSYIEMFDWETGRPVVNHSIRTHLTGAPLLTGKGYLFLPLASYSVDVYDVAAGNFINTYDLQEIGRPLALADDTQGRVYALAERNPDRTAMLVDLSENVRHTVTRPHAVRVKDGVRIEASDVVMAKSAALFRTSGQSGLVWCLYDFHNRRLSQLPGISIESRIVPCSGEGPVCFAAVAADADRVILCTESMELIDLPLHSKNAYVTALWSAPDGSLAVAVSHYDAVNPAPAILEYRRNGARYNRIESRWTELPAKGRHIIGSAELAGKDLLVLASSRAHGCYILHVDSAAFRASSLHSGSVVAGDNLLVQWPDLIFASDSQLHRLSVFGSDPTKHAERLAQAGHWAEAAQLWETCSKWNDAGQAWEKADSVADAVRCYRLHYEQHRDHAPLEQMIGVVRARDEWELEVELLTLLKRHDTAANRIIEIARQYETQRETKRAAVSDSYLACLYDRAIDLLQRADISPWMEPRLTCENKARHYGLRPNLTITPLNLDRVFHIGAQNPIHLVVQNVGRGKALQTRLVFRPALDAIQGQLADEHPEPIGASGSEWRPRLHVIPQEGKGKGGTITLYCQLTYCDEIGRPYELRQQWDIVVPPPEEKSPTIIHVYEGGSMIYGEHIQEVVAGDSIRDHGQKGDRGDQVTIDRKS